MLAWSKAKEEDIMKSTLDQPPKAGQAREWIQLLGWAVNDFKPPCLGPSPAHGIDRWA